MMVLAALSLGSQLVLVADRGVPKLNVEPSCKAAVATAVAVGRDLNSCLADEHAAREQLVQQWSKFSASERNECSQLSVLGGPASYVELLSCLEVSRDAREIARQRPEDRGESEMGGATTGQGSRAPTGATVPNPAAIGRPSDVR